MLVEVTSMMASVPSSSFGSGTVSTRTSRLPCQVTAFIPLTSSRRQTSHTASGRWRNDVLAYYPATLRGNADGEAFRSRADKSDRRNARAFAGLTLLQG